MPITPPSPRCLTMPTTSPFYHSRHSARLLRTLALCGLLADPSCTLAADGGTNPRELGRIRPQQLSEISGMAASRQNPQILWLHNDGDSGLLFAIRTTGQLAALVSCPVEIEDLEEIAIGPGPEPDTDYLYLGDIGDNRASRSAVRVVRIAEPELAKMNGKLFDVNQAEAFALIYPNGPHDAEAMLIDPQSGDLFLVTKEQGRARLYTVTASRLKDGASASLQAAGTLGVDEVSAGAISPDGSRIILRREAEGWLWTRRQGESLAAALQRKPQKIPVLGKRQGPNGEAISFAPGGDHYYTVSEGKKQAMYQFALPAAPAAPER